MHCCRRCGCCGRCSLDAQFIPHITLRCYYYCYRFSHSSCPTDVVDDGFIMICHEQKIATGAPGKRRHTRMPTYSIDHLHTCSCVYVPKSNSIVIVPNSEFAPIRAPCNVADSCKCGVQQSRRASVMVWDTATGVAVSDLAISGACDCFGYGISWSPVTGMLASAHHDRTVRVWNVGTG